MRLMQKFQYQFQMKFGEDTEKQIENQKNPRLRDVKTICLWISYAETRVFGCAAASGQSEHCAKQQNMQIRVVPKHFIASLQLRDLIAKACPCLHSARSRQMSGWKSPGQPVLRTGKEFLLFHKWCCIRIDFIILYTICCSSHPFTAFLMRQRDHGGSSCMPGASAQRLVFCRLSGLVAHLLSDDAAAWCTTTMGCTWQSEGAFFQKNMQLSNCSPKTPSPCELARSVLCVIQILFWKWLSTVVVCDTQATSLDRNPKMTAHFNLEMQSFVNRQFVICYGYSMLFQYSDSEDAYGLCSCYIMTSIVSSCREWWSAEWKVGVVGFGSLAGSDESSWHLGLWGYRCATPRNSLSGSCWCRRHFCNEKAKSVVVRFTFSILQKQQALKRWKGTEKHFDDLWCWSDLTCAHLRSVFLGVQSWFGEVLRSIRP